MGLTRGLDMNSLLAEPGRGNSLTCFAKHALFDWKENIPAPNARNHCVRREAILLMASSSYLDPLSMMAVILLLRREQRKPKKEPPD